MKTCTKCRKDQKLELFNKRSESKDGLSTWCKPCFAEYDKSRYRTVDKDRKDKNREKVFRRNTEKLWEILSSSSCSVCGNQDPEVLEFDHRDGTTKLFNVSSMVRGYSWKTIVDEMEKCDIMCANCHRKRTIRQFGSWRGSMAQYLRVV